MRPISIAAVLGFVIILALGASGHAAAPPHAVAASAAEERALLDEVNRVRGRYGLPALRPDVRLVRAARSHTKGMLRSKTFAHGDMATRLRRFGVRRGRVGENLAWGTGWKSTPAAIVRMWLESPSHRANLLRPGFRRVGLGAAIGPFEGHRTVVVVTADFQGS